MRILIIGAGEVGYHIASRLVRERHDVVVVDDVPEVIDRVRRAGRDGRGGPRGTTGDTRAGGGRAGRVDDCGHLFG